ncbi:MAG: LysE family translocator [Paracoccaceae bacterium]
MVEPMLLLAFLPAALALNLTPGADMMFCLGQGVQAGRRAAIAASAGVALGVLTHAALAGLGLSALIAAAPWSLEAIRWIGVAYLLWLAVSALRFPGAGRSGVAPKRMARAFGAGLMVNLANPKVILFVLAFLPQFVTQAAGPVLPQFLLLGALLALGGFVVNGAVGLFAGGIGRRVARDARMGRVTAWLGAGVFSALALRLALMERG